MERLRMELETLKRDYRDVIVEGEYVPRGIGLVKVRDLNEPIPDETRYEERPMIVSIVTFKLPKRWSVEEAAAVFKSTAPKYLGKPGLVRKHYYLTEAGDKAGGIYLWKSKADAEACYTPEWRAMVTAKYGAAPDIMYGNLLVSVDNLQETIEAA